MVTERREQDRYPSFIQLDILVRDSEGKERTIPIMVRDESPNGIGGVYVGQDPPDIGDEFFLCADGGLRRIRLAWWKKIADYVLLLGFDTAQSD